MGRTAHLLLASYVWIHRDKSEGTSVCIQPTHANTEQVHVSLALVCMKPVVPQGIVITESAFSYSHVEGRTYPRSILAFHDLYLD